MSNILVTGGAGYIGSVCTELLIEKGYSIVVVDNLSTGHKSSVHPKAVFFKADIGDKSQLKKIFKTYSISAVIHFAAETLVGMANTAPNRYYNNNVVKPLNMLDTMRDCGVNKIIFSSSAAVYGNPIEIPITENHAKNPLNAYGESKLIFEKILYRYGLAFGLKHISFRYFNPAGASSDYGEFHDPETHLVPLVLQVAQGKRNSLDVFGSDYPTKDGTCVRDYVHVLDVCMAHLQALEKIDSLSGEAYNLGSETGFTVLEVIEAVKKITKKNVPFTMKGRRMGDPDKLIASSVKAKAELNWIPSHTTLEEMLTSSWNFMNQKRS